MVELPAALLALGRLQQEGGGAPALAAARPAELAAALGSLEATAAAVSAGRLTEWLLSLIEAEAQLAEEQKQLEIRLGVLSELREYAGQVAVKVE